MPEGEQFWNPYRWVTLGDEAADLGTPSYRHSLSGLCGRVACELEALTPLFVGDGKGNFVRSAASGKPFIPGTSLKGAIRSLAEVVGHASAPFADTKLGNGCQAGTRNQGLRLDIVQRTFGYLSRGDSFAGLVRFSDASPIYLPPGQWKPYRVAVGQPKPTHNAFYAGTQTRKFYHHHVGATGLVEAPSAITQTVTLRPAPTGTRFEFSVQFENLLDEELNLLLYCLVLEEEASVHLSAESLGNRADRAGKRLNGAMRHKIGGAKPHGAGSVQIRIKRLVWTDPTRRYRSGEGIRVQEGESSSGEISRRVAGIIERQDATMRELRAMLIYDLTDPRSPIQYPSYEWFKRNPRRRLKPTI